MIRRVFAPGHTMPRLPAAVATRRILLGRCLRTELRTDMKHPKLQTLLLIVCTTTSASAELRQLRIRSREPYAEGRAMGERGPYESLKGTAHFAVDPQT